MKKILIIALWFLLYSAPVLFGGEFEDTLKAAEQGDSHAQLKLSEMYYEGKVVPSDLTKSLYWFRKSADQGNPKAQYRMGKLYYADDSEFTSLPENIKNAIEKFRKSIDFEKAFFWFKKSANQGNKDAQEMLGVLFDLGHGVNQDSEQALYWYKQADIICSIGMRFFNGFSDFPKNYEKAGYWLKYAYDQGCNFKDPWHSPNYYHLGFIYFYGYGVKQNYEKAYTFFEKAFGIISNSNTSHNFSSICLYLGELLYQGLGVEKNIKLGLFLYYIAAIEEAYWNGERRVGKEKQARTKLINILSDIDKSQMNNYEYWVTLGAKSEFGSLGDTIDTNFQKRLANYLYHEKEDYEKAFYWYKKIVENGDKPNPNAQYMLGEFYDFGKGITQNNQKAVYWYKKAARQGVFLAQYNLAIKYGKGEGTPQNYKFAYVWSSISVANNSGKYLRKEAIENRDDYSKYLSPHQLSEAQELAAEIQYRIEHPNQKTKQSPSISNTEKKISSSGTGFFITKDGYILTCHHVIKDAEQIKIVYEGNTYIAKLVRDDKNNDLSLLKIYGSFPAIAFSSKRSAQMGQDAFTIGFPNPGLQGVNAKYTKGTISSLTGFQDDLRLYQISVPVQPGNSGGALLDENGNVLGVIIAMLNAKTAFKISGSLPQNVNYAIKSIYAQAMLDTLPEISNELVSPSKSDSTAVDRAKKSTVLILCYN
ncbi:MAG: trypsin-like serine protease [Desulfobacula sp.]|uniref:trypsin-like peptidase domain-containing protein n=1 Tax=Desulfobacula sp. TaxID=2593537 RepID=UPI001D857A85|nr:trypsin-like serine protease [Desulfobacula sp.]MBT6835160.1 trypsin-like serine protease [Bacteroidota bacterium]MBT7038568.1 trypsin-like serine protease [Bacteroidota bacterium]MBT7794885.1 trypsin-like serine protease [Desulfobacula sp.]